MMKTIASFLSLFIFTLTFSQYPKQTPLNSTPFHNSYSDLKLVQEASQKGVLTKKMSKFLSHKRRPIDQKLAIINALGEGKPEIRNAEKYRNFLLKKYKFSTYNPRIFEKISADEAACIAYFSAMDDVRNAAKEIKFIEWAISKNPNSFSYNLVHTLIIAQKAIDEEMCDVYKAKYELENKSGLEMDMRVEAKQKVFNILDSYKKHCEK